MTTTNVETSTTTPTGAGLLAGKVAFVTGAGRGIGAASARLFAREGATVFLTARTESQLESVTEEIRAAGGTADHAVADLSDAASIRAAVDRAVELYGRLDVAFNNGATFTPPQPLDEVSEADFDHVYAVNLRGAWLAMVAEINAIRATSGTGAIVNNTSIGSLRANPVLPAYGAMKRGVNSLTESAAVTYGPEGIRVNAVSPGVIAEGRLGANPLPEEFQKMLRDLHPLGRFGSAQDVADSVIFLMSEKASFITGSSLVVDGGYMAR